MEKAAKDGVKRMGRPRKADAERMVHIAARLLPADIEYVKGLAGGNFSEGIRRIIEAHIEHTAKAA